ncbi:MAG: dihydropteroate synthase [bacterium]|nr:dihydropteroate synthase [bacterium]
MIIVKKFKNQIEAAKFLKEKLGVYSGGVQIMAPKTEIFNIFLKDIKNQAAAIIKQDILALGGDAAIHADVVRFKEGKNDVLLMARIVELKLLIKKLKAQPYGLQSIAVDLAEALANYLKPRKEPQVMGILNLTPDSFSDGGKFISIDAAVAQADKMILEGADILDLGAESTRPYSTPISETEEIARLMPVLKEVRKRSNVKISVDTYKPNVAKLALNAGADIINDISAELIDVASQADVPIILMHMQNKPNNMQDQPEYDDIVLDIIEYFKSKIKDLDHVIIDPGIGFGKTLEHNLEILRRIDEFKVLGVPIMVGASRKSFIGEIIGKEVGERLAGSLAVAALLSCRGVDILRVHDVGATKDVLKISQKLI